MKRYLILIVLIIANTIQLFADCDMMGMIAKKGNYISWVNQGSGDFDDPYDFFQFMKTRSASNIQSDGYGLIYYKNNSFFYDEGWPGNNDEDHGNPLNQAWYQVGSPSYYTNGSHDWQWELNTGEQKIMESNTKAEIVLGHDRWGTGGSGNHPFRLEINGKYYAFEHNGNVGDYKKIFYDLTEDIDIDWFSNNPSNWAGEVVVDPPDDDALVSWIDSELYFHYIVAIIEDPNGANGDVIQGIYNALSHDNVDFIGSNTPANFILSDGSNIYAYRCTEFDNNNYNLKYIEHPNFWSIRTQNNPGGTNLDQDQLAVFSPYGKAIFPLDYNGFPSEFFSGTIEENTDWNSSVVITGDVTIPSDVTLNINNIVDIASHSKFIINGTVMLLENANFKINYSSEILIENNSELFLDWGSTITGSSGGWSEQIPPGHMPGNEEWILGDRIIAQNGGMIKTDIPNNYTPGTDPVVTIASSSGELWNGISIINPDDNADYWFVNCDISGISNLTISGSSGRARGNLKLYKSNFHDNAQLMARDGHRLFIEGDYSTSCIVQDNSFGVQTYNSPIKVDYAEFTGNGTGLNLNYVCSIPSEITNSNINNNDGNGIVLRDRRIHFENNEVNNNLRNGVLAYSAGRFDNFTINEISNNGWAEYAGYDESYTWSNEANNISDDAYTTSVDRYILKHLDYDGTNPVDVSGNNIDYSNTTRFYPTIDAFDFGQTQIPIEKLLFTSASDDMNSGDYTSAKSTFKQIIVDYPESVEAAASLENIYFIENYTNRDYNSLLLYINSIQPVIASSLERVKRDVTTRTLMQNEDYTGAIIRLETIIENPNTPTELYEAQYDQAYCYVKLVEDGSRSLPKNCTFKPKDFTEFLNIANELNEKLNDLEDFDESTEYVKAEIVSNNYPNPFNPTTTISFNLPTDSDVSVEVYNVKGQKVKTLVNQKMVAGNNCVVWNGDDNNGNKVSSGIYFYKVKTNQSTVMKKIMLLK